MNVMGAEKKGLRRVGIAGLVDFGASRISFLLYISF
jgi:hypothetical protein